MGTGSPTDEIGIGTHFPCSFCGKSQEEVGHTVVGPHIERIGVIAICNECIEICNEIVGKDMEAVNHPAHYNLHPSGVECIDIVEHMGFNIGNVIKYAWRADHKNGLEDLRKAEWYIKREIERRLKSSPESEKEQDE